MLDEAQRAQEGAETETGTISEVIYIGAVTRYVVDLDAGGTLSVVRQNLETSSQEALEDQGRRVVLAWRPESTFTVESSREEEG